MLVGFNKKDCKTVTKGRVPKIQTIYIPDGMKVCCVCYTAKPLDDYRKNKDTQDGHTGACRDCLCERNREYRLAHLKQQRIYYKKWLAANLEYNRKRSREWMVNHAEHVAAIRFDWYCDNAGRISAEAKLKRAKAREVKNAVLAQRSRERHSARLKDALPPPKRKGRPWKN